MQTLLTDAYIWSYQELLHDLCFIGQNSAEESLTGAYALGSTLVILPTSPNRQRKMFEQVATQLREDGKSVKTLSAEQVFTGL
jgi:hypothetical protein